MPYRPLEPNIAWSSETIYHSGDAFFRDFLAALRSARESIDLETYIYTDDELGRTVALELLQAASRGVQVRLLVDGIGSWDWPERYWKDLSRGGVEVRIYHPLPWTFGILERQGMNAWGWILALFSRMNRRNHRKVCVVDGVVAFVGSMNVTAKHLERVSGEKAWRDSGARLEGGSIMELLVAFEWAWHPHRKYVRRLLRGIRNRFGRPPRASRLVRSNHRRYLRRLYYKDLVWRIENAQERVWLTTPYFVPEARLLSALKRAGERGVDVRLIVPANPDVNLIWYAGKVYYGSLIKSGVRVFEYLPRTLHAKIAVLDSFCILGSSNLNQRSLLHDLELDVVLTQPESYLNLAHQFLQDLKACGEVTFDAWMRRPWWTRWTAQMVLVIKRFL